MESIATLRKELEEAIANVRRQIDVQTVSVGYLANGPGMSGSELAIKALENELSQLEDALASLTSRT